MLLAYADFLAERGVTLAELTTEQKLAVRLITLLTFKHRLVILLFHPIFI
jgi:hypothetical protein